VGRGRLSWDQYSVEWARLHGGFDPRKAGPLVRGWLRVAYVIGKGLARVGFSPGGVTFGGLVLCLAVPLLAGHPALAALFVLLAAMADSADGATAVITGRATRLGYVVDSVADRLGEVAWLVAFWLVGAPGMLVVAVGGLSWLHEYVRARVAAAGLRDIGVVTVGERPTRVSIAFAGLLLAGTVERVQGDLPAGTITVVSAVWVLVVVAGLLQLATAFYRALR
jgi:CDP-diacylglycerol--glycerol-3-phosphate 3-phosphatidyltransferase